MRKPQKKKKIDYGTITINEPVKPRRGKRTKRQSTGRRGGSRKTGPTISEIWGQKISVASGDVDALESLRDEASVSIGTRSTLKDVLSNIYTEIESAKSVGSKKGDYGTLRRSISSSDNVDYLLGVGENIMSSGYVLSDSQKEDLMALASDKLQDIAIERGVVV